MKVTLLHPSAEQDLQEAAGCYGREGSPALAARFVAEFKRLAQLLIDYPEIGSPRSKGRRGFAMSVFPSTLVERATTMEVSILVIQHDSKRPGYGGRRS